MKTALHVGRPNIGDLDVFHSLTDGIFERRWFSNNGEVVQELEKRLCQYLGVGHCIPVCNATVGLQIASTALDIAGEVIVPAYTFVATPHALQWQGIKPIFADIDPVTHNIDPAKIECLITERTSAIVGVHVWGRPCDTDAISAIAEQHGLSTMYDAAHAFGGCHQGKMIGNFGRCEVFSFHATKFFNTFEGGAIATNDDGLAAKIRRIKNFGFAGMDNVQDLGTNGKMSEIHAAMGLSCFAVLDELLAKNKTHYQHYRDRLSNLPGLRFLDYDKVEQCNHQYIVIEIDAKQSPVDRDTLMARLHQAGIRSRRYFYPGCHRMQPYASLYPERLNSLPETDALCARVIILPSGASLATEDIDRVCTTIESSLT